MSIVSGNIHASRGVIPEAMPTARSALNDSVNAITAAIMHNSTPGHNAPARGRPRLTAFPSPQR